MTESNESRERLAAMAADALVEDTLEAELLLRFASDPDALARTERERVEFYLAASPAHRQQLRSLVRFEETRRGLVGEGRSGSGGGSGGSTIAEISSPPRWRTRVVLLAAALAASLLAALLYGTQGDLGTGARLANEGASAGESPRPSIPVESVPELRPVVEVEEQKTQLAQESEEQGIESHVPAPLTPEIPRRVPPRAYSALETAPIPAPAPESVQPLESSGAPDVDETPEPILLAVNVSGPLVYMHPESAIELAFLGELRNAPPGLPNLQVLVPSHVAQTLSESPSLYWYLFEDTEFSVEFVLVDRVSVDPLFGLRLESPLAAGIHVVNLAAHDVVLEPGKEYRWFVSLSSDGGIASDGVVARGAVMRVEPPDDVLAALEAAPPGERGRIYAERGFWYDALGFISASIDRDPEDERLRELRAGLLEGGGLSEAADYDRRTSAHVKP